tara:strand:+ start:41 stop:292 length:252 start_codon:yes stop_codon:yes gene_type:complete
MTDFPDLFNNPLVILFLSFVILLSFMWLFLPFAIYGLRNKLDRIINLLEDISFIITEKKNSEILHQDEESSTLSEEDQRNNIE